MTLFIIISYFFITADLALWENTKRTEMLHSFILGCQRFFTTIISQLIYLKFGCYVIVNTNTVGNCWVNN